MKLNKLFSLAFVAMAAFAISSCTCDCSKMGASVADDKEDVSGTTRGEAGTKGMSVFAKAEKFKFEGDATKLETIGKVESGAINSADDAEAVKSIMRILMGAENPNQQLDIEFAMSDEPVGDGMFVFSIKSEDDKALTLQMYDEEGFDMVAYNKLQINTGNNYKVLNVNEFENGGYLFKLTDDSGKEMIRRVEVSKN